MSIFDSLFNKLTPTDKAALTAALGWLSSIDREYNQKNADAQTRDVWNDPKYYPQEEAKKDD